MHLQGLSRFEPAFCSNAIRWFASTFLQLNCPSRRARTEKWHLPLKMNALLIWTPLVRCDRFREFLRHTAEDTLWLFIEPTHVCTLIGVRSWRHFTSRRTKYSRTRWNTYVLSECEIDTHEESHIWRLQDLQLEQCPVIRSSKAFERQGRVAIAYVA